MYSADWVTKNSPVRDEQRARQARGLLQRIEHDRDDAAHALEVAEPGIGDQQDQRQQREERQPDREARAPLEDGLGRGLHGAGQRWPEARAERGEELPGACNGPDQSLVKMPVHLSMFSSALPEPQHHAGERIFGHDHRQAGLFHQQAVDVAQQRAAAGQHHALLGDVGAEFRRGLLERGLDRADDAVERVGQRFQDLVGRDGEAARDAFREVAALDFLLAHFRAREGGADFLLDLLGGGLADQHAVVAADVVDDRLVELVAADPDRGRIDDAAQGDHAHFRGAAADVDHHGAGGFRDRQAGADGRGHGLLDQLDLAGAGAEGRLADRPALDLGRAAGHADDDARAAG